MMLCALAPLTMKLTQRDLGALWSKAAVCSSALYQLHSSYLCVSLQRETGRKAGVFLLFTDQLLTANLHTLENKTLQRNSAMWCVV